MAETKQRVNGGHPLMPFRIKVSELSEDDQYDFLIMQVEPVSWSVIAGIFLVELARGAGKKFGEGLGAALANAFFGQSKAPTITDLYFKEQLEALYQKIVEAITRTLHESEIRSNVASVAGAQMNFIEFIRAYRARFDELSNLDQATAEPYAQAISLLPYSLPAFMNIGVIRMAYAMERYARKGKTEAVNARERIDDVLKRGRKAVDEMLPMMKSRVASEDGERTLTCLCHGPGRVAQSVDNTFDTSSIADTSHASNISNEPEPQMIEECYPVIKMYYMLLDGTRVLEVEGGNCNAEFATQARDRRNAAVAKQLQDFEALWEGRYNQPMQALERQGNQLLHRLPK